jgi:hypothetical protein
MLRADPSYIDQELKVLEHDFKAEQRKIIEKEKNLKLQVADEEGKYKAALGDKAFVSRNLKSKIEQLTEEANLYKVTIIVGENWEYNNHELEEKKL